MADQEAACDAVRDALALVQAALTGDEMGSDAILNACDRRRVAAVLAELAARLLRGRAAQPTVRLAAMRHVLLSRATGG
jgi:hypothetical protein